MALGSAGQRWAALGSAGQRWAAVLVLVALGSAGQRWAARVAIDRCPAVKKALLSAALKSLL